MAPHPRFDNLPDEQRHAILDAAADEFAREGFDGASVQRIAAAADLSKGSLYYYFDGKEDLYATVLDDLMDRVVEVVADLHEPTDAASYWQMLFEGMQRLDAAFFEDERAIALGRGLYRRAGSGDAYERLMQRSQSWMRQLVELGQRAGAVRRDVPVGLLAESLAGMLLAMDRWFVMQLDEVSMDELRPLVPKTMELVRDLVTPRRAPEEES